MPITDTPEWHALEQHFEEVRDTHLRDLFAADPQRGERLTVEGEGLYLDYSKNRVTDETLRLLLELARRAGLRERIDAMFRGDKINVTEDRAVLHTALRAPEDATIVVDGENVVPQVHAVLRKMADFSEKVRSGQWRGHTGSADSQRREHRHRWLRPRPEDGLHRAPGLQPARHDVPLRQQRRRQRLLGVHPRPRSRRDALHRGVEDVHHARDAHQRAQRPRVAARRARRRVRRRQALRGGVDERGRGRQVRDRHREHVRVLGLGGRPLLVRQRDRAVGDGRDRSRAVRRDARGVPLDRRALPHRAVRAEPARAHGAHRHLVRRLLRRARRRRSSRTASTSSGSPRTSSSSTWRATGSRSTSTATR